MSTGGDFACILVCSALVLLMTPAVGLFYAPVAHWVWGGGWISKLDLFGGTGVLDFAGGKVVHITSGVSALVFAVVIGRRFGIENEKIKPYNASFTLLGSALLWFGWFGFNGGSALAANGTAVHAIVTTKCAAAAGALAWLLLAWAIHKKPSVIGVAVGAVAGLVAITPGAGYVMPMAALLMGALTSGVCFYVSEYVVRGRIDDALDVFGVHGVGGICGVILTAVFASTLVPGNDTDGLLDGNGGLLTRQIIAILAVVAYSAVGTLVILKVINAVKLIRVSSDDEATGLDISQHGESVAL